MMENVTLQIWAAERPAPDEKRESSGAAEGE